MVREDGTIFRNDYQDQWAACVVAKKADGTRIKKAESLALKTGARIYRTCETPVNIIMHDVDETGRCGPDFKCKKVAHRLVPYTLVEL